MARSLGGGGGSGGGRSFGGSSFGGSRSFGGSHLGSSSTRRVSSGSSYRSGSNYRSGSSFHIGGGMPPPPPRYGRSYYRRTPTVIRGGGTPLPGTGCGTGCGSIFLGVIVVVLILAFIGVFAKYNTRPADNYGSYDGSGTSTAGYGCEKYTGDVDSSKGYWTDESTGDEKWIDNTNKKYLEDGFSSFYEKTGVFPFLYVTDTYGDSGKFGTFEEKVYDDLFGDCPGNLLFVFISKEESYYIAAGIGTGSVVNEKTVPSVIQSRITNAWNSSSNNGDLAKIFGNALIAAGTQLMKEAETSKLASSNFKTIIIVLIIAITVIILLLLIIHWWKKKKEKQKEEDERLEHILSQPLSTFGNMEINQLGQKYDGPGDNNNQNNNPNQSTQ